MSEEIKVVPWPEMVKIHEDRQNAILGMIQLYQVIVEDPSTPEDAREKTRERIRFYQLEYLGLSSKE